MRLRWSLWRVEWARVVVEDEVGGIGGIGEEVVEEEVVEGDMMIGVSSIFRLVGWENLFKGCIVLCSSPNNELMSSYYMHR